MEPRWELTSTSYSSAAGNQETMTLLLGAAESGVRMNSRRIARRVASRSLGQFACRGAVSAKALGTKVFDLSSRPFAVTDGLGLGQGAALRAGRLRVCGTVSRVARGVWPSDDPGGARRVGGSAAPVTT